MGLVKSVGRNGNAKEQGQRPGTVTQSKLLLKVFDGLELVM